MVFRQYIRDFDRVPFQHAIESQDRRAFFISRFCICRPSGVHDFFFVDGMDESLRQYRETPFIYTVMLPVTGIVGLGYGGLLGLFSYAVFRANRMETVRGSQDSAVETSAVHEPEDLRS